MIPTMIHRIALSGFLLFCLVSLAPQAHAYPEPSKFPISWQLRFDFAEPRRIVVEIPGSATPKAYWYLTYTVTNNTDKEQTFLPALELVTKSGKVVRSDRGVPQVVFERVKAANGNKLLESALQIGGVLRVGDDQAKDGVAIWEEPESEMGSFSIFVSGLSGESTPLTDSAGKPMNDKDGKPIILFKTLQLDYTISGDEVYPGIDPITKSHERWVMR